MDVEQTCTRLHDLHMPVYKVKSADGNGGGSDVIKTSSSHTTQLHNHFPQLADLVELLFVGGLTLLNCFSSVD